jgi:hypothetical protein
MRDIDALIPGEPSGVDKTKLQQLEAHLEVLFHEFATNRGRTPDRALTEEIKADLLEVGEILERTYGDRSPLELDEWHSIAECAYRAFSGRDASGSRRAELARLIQEVGEQREDGRKQGGSLPVC